jgi:hypothetical protein
MGPSLRPALRRPGHQTLNRSGKGLTRDPAAAGWRCSLPRSWSSSTWSSSSGRPTSGRGKERASKFAIDSKAVGEDVDAGGGAGGQRLRTAGPLLVFLHGRGGATTPPSDQFFDAPRPETSADRRLPGWRDHSISTTGRKATGALRRAGWSNVVQAIQRRSAARGVAASRWAASVARHCQLNPERFCAVGAHSPAIWHTGGETAQETFDDSADFERHDVPGGNRLPAPY